MALVVAMARKMSFLCVSMAREVYGGENTFDFLACLALNVVGGGGEIKRVIVILVKRNGVFATTHTRRSMVHTGHFASNIGT